MTAKTRNFFFSNQKTNFGIKNLENKKKEAKLESAMMKKIVVIKGGRGDGMNNYKFKLKVPKEFIRNEKQIR